MVSSDFLEMVDIFQGFDSEQLTGVSQCCTLEIFQKGDRIHQEGGAADFLWVSMEGRIELRFDLPGRRTSAENTISVVSETKAFGWSSFVPPYIYRLSAYCVSKTCKVLRLDKEQLNLLFEKDVKAGFLFMTNLTAIVGSRLQQLQTSARKSRPVIMTLIVHLATCGIAAGARNIMATAIEEVGRLNRQDIKIVTGGCLSKCSTEPNVTVEIPGEEPVVYQKMTPDKIRRVIQKHLLLGEIQKEDVLTNNPS